MVTRPKQVEHLELPREVTLHGRLERQDYLALLGAAGVVVVPTEVREYPTGQTVLLEAMAMGKACVVSDTPAMREYVEHGVTALLVPPHDPLALRGAVDRLRADPALRQALGEAARSQELAAGGSATMWAEVAAGLPLRR
jgi:glycosyltransferase involved in cell wall biosynthesis